MDPAINSFIGFQWLFLEYGYFLFLNIHLTIPAFHSINLLPWSITQFLETFNSYLKSKEGPATDNIFIDFL